MVAVWLLYAAYCLLKSEHTPPGYYRLTCARHPHRAIWAMSASVNTVKFCAKYVTADSTTRSKEGAKLVARSIRTSPSATYVSERQRGGWL